MAITEMTSKILTWSPLIGTTVGGLFLSLLVDHFTPGRKGKLRTERDHFFANFSAQQVGQEMGKRLAAEGFEVQPSESNVLKAIRRKKRPKDSMMREYPFDKLKVYVEVNFTEREDGVIARMAAGTMDTITRDTGEGIYLEALLDLVMLRNDLTEIGAVPNLYTHLAMYESILLPFLPVLFFIPGMDAEHSQPYLVGLVISCLATIGMGAWGLIQISVSQGKYEGNKPGLIALGLSILGMGIALAVFFLLKQGS